VRVAVRDPHVVAIKMTLYRIGPNSPLIPAAHRGRGGRQAGGVLVELKARSRSETTFCGPGAGVARDSRRLWIPGPQGAREAVPRRAAGAGGIQRYVHTGTGNYNPETAKVYTDIGLFTADPDIVADVSEIFNSLTGYSNQKDYRSLLMAPCSSAAG
jgi:polyphosphate kinase